MISRDQFIVYILEATAIAVVGTVVLGRSPIDTSLFLLITSLACANIIMDLYAPKIAPSMRQGAGFGLGMKQVGGTTEEIYDARPKPDLVSRIAEFKENNPPPPGLREAQLSGKDSPEIRQWKKKVLPKMIAFSKEALIKGDYENMGRTKEQVEQDLQRLTKDLQDLFKSESESVARLIKGEEAEAEARFFKEKKEAEKARLVKAEKARFFKAEKERFFKEKEAEKARFFKEKEAEKPVKPLSAGISGETYNAAFEIFRTTNNLKGASPDQLKQIFDKPNASKWYEMANTLNNHAKTIMKNTSDRFDSENMCQTKLDKICADYGQDSEPCKLSKELLPYMMHQPFTNIDSSNRSNCATFPPEHILRGWPKPVVKTQKPTPVKIKKLRDGPIQKPPVKIKKLQYVPQERDGPIQKPKPIKVPGLEKRSLERGNEGSRYGNEGSRGSRYDEGSRYGL